MFTWLTHSKIRLKMLKMFFKDLEQPLYGLEIAQQLKTSPGTTHRELNAMVKQGVLNKVRQGALVLYTVNTQHAYFHELEKAINPPKKKADRVLFISDLHLSVETPPDLISDLMKFFDYAQENATELVLVGDMIEMLKGDVFHTYLLYKPVFDRLSRLAQEVQVTYLVGNHDCFISLLVGQKFFSAPIVFAYDYSNEPLNIYASHGHQYDDFSEAKDFKSKKKVEANGKIIAQLIQKIGLEGGQADLLKQHASYAEKALHFAQYVSEKKIDCSQKLEGLAKQYIEGEDYAYVVFGHAHKAGFKQLGDGVYFNTGSWKSEKKRQFVEIDKDGGALISIADVQ
ncbi:MAG: metallophosphoesterase [bacterium]|nr:metallophosphoesterase [bacterium]